MVDGLDGEEKLDVVSICSSPRSMLTTTMEISHQAGLQVCIYHHGNGLLLKVSSSIEFGRVAIIYIYYKEEVIPI